MRRITGAFTAAHVRIWHRFAPPGSDIDALAAMVGPMDDVGDAPGKLAERALARKDTCCRDGQITACGSMTRQPRGKLRRPALRRHGRAGHPAPL